MMKSVFSFGIPGDAAMNLFRYGLGFALTVTVVAMLAGEAKALKEVVELTPKNVETNGFTISAEAQANDVIRVKIVRDLAKAKSFPAASPYDLWRDAELRIFGDKGLLVQFGLQPAAGEKSVTYTFAVKKDQLSDTHVTVYEYDGYKDRTRKELPIGGGTLFKFHFKAFTDLLLSDKPAAAKEDKASARLEDGVYPVLAADDPKPEEHGVVELVVVPVDEDGAPKPETIRVTDQPLLRFKTLSQFDFKFEEGECTEIGFANTPELKAYTRDHVGAQLAVVVDNRVISHHKIREPIESDTVRITCCTVGGGDHLHKHLKELKLATESNSRADNQQQREEDER
jgi:hypothetical protein